MDNMKESSPFTPGNPVPIELFVGRAEPLEEILKYVRQTSAGKQENIFLAGERGIGKSSFARFLRTLACRENLLAVHVFLGEVTTLEEMARRVIEQILKESNSQPWYNKISGYFRGYIEQLDLFGVAVSFRPPEDKMNEILRNFPEALKNIADKIKEDKKGLFIVLDDIDSISKTPEFANWFKSFVDKVATHYSSFPICIMLIGLPEIRDNLSLNQPSLMRIFRVVEIDKLKDSEVKSFFERAFGKANLKVEDKAMDVMVRLSSGLPIFMHEIGDAVFWINQDDIIRGEDVEKGIVSAADNIGKKYLDPKVYRAIRSESYRSILRKLGENLIFKFKKQDMMTRLNENEQRVFDNFLRKMRDLGVIINDPEGGRGSYRFANEIYPIYIWMESSEHRSKR